MTTFSDFTRFPAQRFIETGTGKGETLAFACNIYEECLSVELDPGRYAEAMVKFYDRSNVHLFSGHSVRFLKALINPTVKTVFWLDAHYTESDPEARKEYGMCPLAEELKEIIHRRWVQPPTILIDDCSSFRLGLHGWPKLEQLDEIMVGWRRDQISEEVFSYA